MPDRVLVAESEIQARQRVLSEDHGGTLGSTDSQPVSEPELPF